MITDPGEIRKLANGVSAASIARLMLVKVPVEHASYYEQLQRTMNLLESCWHAICKYLFQENPVRRPYKLHPIKLA